MGMSLTEDFKTMDDLEKQAATIVAQVRRTGRPVVVTVQGKPEVVIFDADTYEKKLKVANLRDLLGEAEASIQAGRTRPIDEFWDELQSGQETRSRQNHTGRRKRHRRTP